MTASEQKAIKDNLQFTGYVCHPRKQYLGFNNAQFKEKLEELRHLGFRARTVWTSSGFKAIYAERAAIKY